MKTKNIKLLLDAIAENGTCTRMQTAAVVVKNGVIVSLGYNGAVRGSKQCDSIGCLIINNHCERSIHAEENCILNAARTGVELLGAKMYSLHMPCKKCIKAITNAGINEVCYFNSYSDEVNEQLAALYEVEHLLTVRRVTV